MVARGQPTAGPLKCRGHYAAGGSASTPRVAVGTRARREQQVAQKVPLALGALQGSRLLVGCQAGEKAMQILGHEIGRASCRERVCQYVEISGVAVSLKKTTIYQEARDTK